MTGGSGAGAERSLIGADFAVVLADAQRGGGAGFARIYASLAPVVTAYLRAQGADEPDDVASEVFLGVFSGCPSFAGNEAKFRSWVFTIAHSRLVDARRHRGKAPDVLALEPEGLDVGCPTIAGAEEEAMDHLGIEHVLLLLDELTPDQSEVLVLRMVSQLSVEEVAVVVDKPPEAVKALQRRALAKLRRTLGPKMPDA